MDNGNLAALLEAYLFAKGSPATLQEISDALHEDSVDIEDALEHLKKKYESSDSGITLHENGAGFSLTTKKIYSSWLSETLGKQTPLSQAAMETLAVVACKEPVTRASIEKIRGVSAGRVLTSLMEKGLIEERGRLDVPGHPILYGTTKLFLQSVGLSSVKELKLKWKSEPDEGDLF